MRLDLQTWRESDFFQQRLVDEQRKRRVMKMLSLWTERLPVATLSRLLPGDTVTGEGRWDDGNELRGKIGVFFFFSFCCRCF